MTSSDESKPTTIKNCFTYTMGNQHEEKKKPNKTNSDHKNSSRS